MLCHAKRFPPRRTLLGCDTTKTEEGGGACVRTRLAERGCARRWETETRRPQGGVWGFTQDQAATVLFSSFMQHRQNNGWVFVWRCAVLSSLAMMMMMILISPFGRKAGGWTLGSALPLLVSLLAGRKGETGRDRVTKEEGLCSRPSCSSSSSFSSTPGTVPCQYYLVRR